MKSFTDFEQSKKLAEILPNESADMRYGYISPYDYSDRMYDGMYICDKGSFPISQQDEYELVAKKIEPKPADKVGPKFHEGDWVVDNECGKVNQITSVRNQGYDFANGDYMSYESAHKELRLWDISDAKDGEVLYSFDSKQPFIFKHRKPNEQAEVYCGINIYGKFFIGNTKDCVITTDKYIPSDKFQRDLLFKKMQKAGYEWDAEKKELKKVEEELENYKQQVMSEMTDLVTDYIRQKPTWSKEDEDASEDIEEAVINYWGGDTQDIILDWLKSLKDRVQPHPKQEWSERDKEEYQIAIDTLVATGQRDSAHWLESLKQRIVVK